MLENADPHALARPEEFHAGDPVLLCLLGGAVPADAERLAVEGSGEDGHVWTQGGDLLLVTRAYLLSPGPPATLGLPIAGGATGARKRERPRNAVLVLLNRRGRASDCGG